MNNIVTRKWEVQPPISMEMRNQLPGYHPVLQQLLHNRGISNEIDASVYLDTEGSLNDPFGMKGMNEAVARLLAAMDSGEQIAIYGDYDVDGVTATALLVQVVRRMGGLAREYIPNRFEEGYGVNNDALDTLHAEGVKVIVTVDCGIRSPDEARHAWELGIDLIISDHHEPKDELPQAYAVICPKQAGDTYLEKNLAGVGLAYKIAQALLQKRPTAGVDVDEWLDLVAVGTVADIVPLKGENRSLVRKGLKLLNRRARQGLHSLAGAAGMESGARISSRDIGFKLGPRLNAAGRMESALAAYQLLMTDDVTTAGELATGLNDQNTQRQDDTLTMQKTAEAMMAEIANDELCFAVDAGFSKGIVGLVAAKLAEQHYRPAVVGEMDEAFTRASCRSIPEFHITHALDEMADLLVRHGGHAMAAGFTVSNENLPELERRLKAIARRDLADKNLQPVLRADMEIELRDLRGNLLELIDRLEPFGNANPEVLFVTRNALVKSFKKIGGDKHLRMMVSPENEKALVFNAVAFRQAHWAEHMPERVDLLFSFELNSFNGRDTLQLNVKDIQPSR